MLPFILSGLLSCAPSASTLPVRDGGKIKTVSLEQGAKTRTLFDLQYRGKRTVTGVGLDQLVRTVSSNVIVLRFDNGVLVPVLPARAKEVFIATSWTRQDGHVESAFPEMPRRPEFNLDPRPVTFKANKVVVETGDAGGLPAPVGRSFSPWLRTSSVVAIEVMRDRDFAAQFAPTRVTDKAAAAVRVGQDVFVRRCAYCHGVNDNGASFGTDVVVGVPLAERYTVDSLLSQVSTHKLNDYNAGLMMPPQKDLTRAEARQLHAYFSALKAAPPKPPSKNQQRGAP